MQSTYTCMYISPIFSVFHQMVKFFVILLITHSG